MEQASRENDACRRLVSIPGVRPVTAIIAATGNGDAFRKGREFSAWVGMVPGEIQPAANKDCWASASAAMTICADCPCKVHAH
jgi:transposase